ncbi:MAG: hypothetical protein ABW157_13225 [Candidatus Thiodiazotropha sp. LLP2]
MDSDQKITVNKNISRKKLLSTLSQYEPTTVVMEACYTSHPCKVIVALANKLARVAWAVLATGKAYQAL